MNEQTDIRRMWRREWLSCLADFANSDVQRRRWIDLKNSNPHWSYVEFMCSYFDDMLRGDTYKWAIAEGLVTTEEAAVVAPLHELLTRHEPPGGDAYDNAAILADPAWQQIVEAAVLAKKNILAMLTETEEIAMLLDAC